MVKLKPGAEYLAANRRFSEALLMLIDHALEGGLSPETVLNGLEVALTEGPEGLEQRVNFLIDRQEEEMRNELLKAAPSQGTA